MKSDFEKFLVSNGTPSSRLDQYLKTISPRMGLIEPMILEERELNVASMSCFSRLLYDRIIFLGTEIDSDVANIISSQLLYLNSVDSKSDIKLFINSPGGQIASGLMIVDVMNWINPDVSTYCMGTAASMASVILACGEKGKRFALPHGEVLLHQPLGGTGYAQASDIEIMNNHIQKYKNELYKILSDKTGKSITEIKNDCDRDYWLTASDAKEYGLIDEIIKKDKRK